VQPKATLLWAGQVIPTVGVSGEGAENEKKVAVQLKHFRNLVDENASKVRRHALAKGANAKMLYGESTSRVLLCWARRTCGSERSSMQFGGCWASTST